MKTEQQLRSIAGAHTSAADCLAILIDAHAGDNMAQLDGRVLEWRRQAAKHIQLACTARTKATEISNAPLTTHARIMGLSNHLRDLQTPNASLQFKSALEDCRNVLKKLAVFF